ncbi:sigma-70 family RNA polymerase sigma factor [Micromonospora sp. NPDC003816]|uniref:sigma-70 family RNA polymerase sigma factor n=1 Tax=Micromonospora sp. NPDC003816 TaxID=3364224 RepID=UPI00369AE017
MAADEFETFVHRSAPVLRRYARAVAADPDRAEDLLQETYVRVAGVWHRVLADGNPVEYAKVEMIRLHIGRLRTLVRLLRPTPPASPPVADGRSGRQSEPGRVAESGPDRVADLGSERVEDGGLLRRLLAGLPPVQRAVLVLAYLDDLDDAAIAEAVGRRPAAVRSLRRRALDAIRPGLPAVRAGALPEVVR